MAKKQERRTEERRKELAPPLTRELDQTFWDGIRKTLYWVVGTDNAYVHVQDERQNGEFYAEVPPPPCNPYDFMRHIMARAPDNMQRGKAGSEPTRREYGDGGL